MIVPQNLEAEEAVLGAMIMSPRAIEIVEAVGLQTEDFYRPSHQIVFDAIRKLAETDSVDEQTIVDALKRSNLIGKVGGPVAIVGLAERVPAVSNARAYAEEVKDQAVFRRLVDAGHQIGQLGYEHPESADVLVSTASEIVASIVGSDTAAVESSGTFADALGDIYDDMTRRKDMDDDISGLRTGFAVLDAFTGGLQPGNTYVIAARPGVGKTSLAMNIAEHVAVEQQKSTLVFSLEMSRREVFARMIAGRAKIDSRRITSRKPFDSDFEHVVKATTELRSKGASLLHVDDTSSISASEMRIRARRRARTCKRDGHPLGLVLVDYLQLARGGAQRSNNRQEEVAQISRELKGLAGELGVPVIALSQLSRGLESREDKRPMLSDLRESGAIEQDASAVIFIHRPELFLGENCTPELKGKAEIIISKNRHGETGSCWLGWQGQYTRFHNIDSKPKSMYVAGAPSIT